MSRSPSAAWSRSAAGRFIARGRRSSSPSVGSSLDDTSSPWMDGLMQFVQVDATGRPEPLDDEPDDEPLPLPPPWSSLRDRARKLLHIRH